MLCQRIIKNWARTGIIFHVFIATTILLPVFAQTPVAGPTDPAELEAFIDGIIDAHFEAYDIAGATVSAVKNGRMFFAKGYGYADVETKEPVMAGETLFRIGSISKLFVWTSVMQLFEQGKLDLNTDINTYLADFKIPETYDKPVTLTHLLTHTPGFEDVVVGLFAKDESKLLPLGEILNRELPARVRPPGDVASYSNHGTGMAAYIVEQVSGMTWDDYVEENILKPLRMEHTTFRQPVPELLLSNLSKGYTYGGGEFHEEDFEFIPLAPAGAAGTTAEDIARFMIAHLNRGRLGRIRILSEGTARLMQQPLFRHADAVNPMAHGFIDMSMNGHRVIGHGGDTFWFHSMMALLPDYGVGIFVSYNSQGGGEATRKFYEAFMNRYYPAGDIPQLAPSEDAQEQLHRFVGTYHSNRYPHRSLAKLIAAFGATEVSLTENGFLKTDVIKPKRWVQIDSLTFREQDGLGTLAFRENEEGRITHMFMGDLPILAFDRIDGIDLPSFHLTLLIIAMVLFILTLIFSLIAAIIRRRHMVLLDPETAIPFTARLLLWLTCILLVAFALGMAMILSPPYIVVFGIPTSLEVILFLPLLATLLILGVLVCTVYNWMKNKGSLWGRIHYTVITLLFIVSIWQLYYWNLWGFRF